MNDKPITKITVNSPTVTSCYFVNYKSHDFHFMPGILFIWASCIFSLFKWCTWHLL